MSSWASVASDSFRHPWFSHPTLKRKHSDSSDEDVARDPDSDHDTAPSFYPTLPPESASYVDNDGEFTERKRRRCDTIERRMACMYIDGRNANAGYPHVSTWDAPPMTAAAPSTASNVSYAYTAGSTSPISQSALLPQYAVEEPVSPEFKNDVMLAPPNEQIDEPLITEVRMKGAEPAWYEREKDRIVITDLDEAVEEAEEEEYKSEAEPHPDAAEHADSNADWSVSTILLDHIKKQANFPFVPPSEQKGNSGALVLFKPPPLPFFSPPSSDASEPVHKEDENRGVKAEEINESEGHHSAVSMDQEEEAGEPMDMDMDIEL